jgi:hypothetical protein
MELAEGVPLRSYGVPKPRGNHDYLTNAGTIIPAEL